MALPGIDGITDSDGLCGGCYGIDCDGTNCARLNLNTAEFDWNPAPIDLTDVEECDELPF